jgi:hypothetical protein
MYRGLIFVEKVKAKFLMLVVSQQCVSQLQKDAPFTTEEKGLYLLKLSSFLWLRCVSLRYDKRQKFDLLMSKTKEVKSLSRSIQQQFCQKLFLKKLFFSR